MACLQCLLELRFAESASDTGDFFAGMEVQVYLTEIHVSVLLPDAFKIV